MTPTQIARRSDALYADGTCGMTRRVLCDMVAQREADIESLKAKNTKLQEQGERLFDKTLELLTENAKLREELAKARDPQRIGGQADPSSFVYAIEQLREFRWQHATNDEEAIPYINNVVAAHERENAKLRELVRDLYLCSDETCTDCEHHNYSGKGFWCKRGVGWKRARMRELGVEVDDGQQRDV